jgi:hypothetical protein
MKTTFSFISRFVAMAGIGGIAQSVASDLLAKLSNPNLSNAEFDILKRDAESRGYILEKP